MMKIVRIVSFFPACLLMAVIFMFSASPGKSSSELSDGISYQMIDVVGNLPFFDWDAQEKISYSEAIQGPVRKAAHFGEYALLGILWAAPLGFCCEKQKKRLSIALIICFLYACTDEIHQLFVPGRDGNSRDVLIDTSGAAVGILLLFLGYIKRRKTFGK